MNFVSYLYDEFWAGDVELLCSEGTLMSGDVLQNNC